MRQTKNIKETGSFVNWAMGNNVTLPEVNKGATELHWSDRSAWEVISVADDKMSCVIERYSPKRIDKNGMSESQEYEYTKLTGHRKKLVWRNKKGGCWCEVTDELRIIPKVAKYLETKTSKFMDYDQVEDVFGKDVADKVWRYDDNDDRIMEAYEGITKIYKKYTPMSIVFGYKHEYYDYSF